MTNPLRKSISKWIPSIPLYERFTFTLERDKDTNYEAINPRLKYSKPGQKIGYWQLTPNENGSMTYTTKPQDFDTIGLWSIALEYRISINNQPDKIITCDYRLLNVEENQNAH